MFREEIEEKLEIIESEKLQWYLEHICPFRNNYCNPTECVFFNWDIQECRLLEEVKQNDKPRNTR